jgi:phage tail sheath protein FI
MRREEKQKVRTHRKFTLSGYMLLLLFLFAACGGANNSSSANSGQNGSIASSSQTTIPVKTTPVLVKPKSVRGSSGDGPMVVTSQGGGTNGGQVVLKDRTLMISSVTKQNSTNARSILITLVLTVKNTSNKPIMNQSTFFQLMGTEGDTFTYQLNSTDSFYGTVPALGSHNGTIVFQIPKAAASNLRLLYRPEITTETALISLKV